MFTKMTETKTESCYCGLDHKWCHHNQGGDEQKLYAMWSELFWLRDSTTYGYDLSFCLFYIALFPDVSQKTSEYQEWYQDVSGM